MKWVLAVLVAVSLVVTGYLTCELFSMTEAEKTNDLIRFYGWCTGNIIFSKWLYEECHRR